MSGAQDSTSLTLDVRPGEYLMVGGNVRVELVQKSGRAARLKVTAPPQIEVKLKPLDACEFRGKHGEIGTS